MTTPPLILTGNVTQSDAATLKDLALAQIDSGAVAISAKNLKSIEFGAVQVLLCAANDAKRRGLRCALDPGAARLIDDCLAAVHLPDSTTFFTILPTAEVSASS